MIQNVEDVNVGISSTQAIMGEVQVYTMSVVVHALDKYRVQIRSPPKLKTSSSSLRCGVADFIGGKFTLLFHISITRVLRALSSAELSSP